METELITTEQQLVEFGGFRSPDQTAKEWKAVAAVFAREARALNLYKKIGESEHLLVEGWQMLGALYRVTASISCTRHIVIGDAQGWEATAEAIFVPTGQKISSADAMCLDDEDKWGMVSKYEYQNGKRVKIGDVPKPLQQLRSMAQTRAQSKVLSNLLKFVAKMAGFSPTPAEEADVERGPDYQQPPARQQQPAGNVITEAQSKRLYAIGKQSGKSDEQLAAILKHYGFEHSKDITRDRYDAICAEVMKGENQ